MSRFGDISIDSLPPHAQAKARAMLDETRRHIANAARETFVKPNLPKPMRVPKAAKMNRTETAFSLRLEALKRDGQIADWKFGAITLLLAPGLRYTPDFSVFEGATLAGNRGVLSFIEVKNAFVRDDARAKLLMAARAYPWFRFTLAQLVKGEWTQTEISK